MDVRLPGTTELNINSDTLKGNLREVRAQLDQISFDDGITVLSLQPEIGKTESFLRYCVANTEKNIAYFSPNHTLLDEVENELNQRLPLSNVIRWKGKNKSCLEIENPILSILNKNKVSFKWFCESCNHYQDCTYLNQFNYPNPSIILAPSAYIGTSYIRKNFDIIFVDELLKDCKEYSWGLDSTTVNNAIEILMNISSLPDDAILREFSEIPNHPENLENNFKEFNTLINKGINHYLTDFENLNLLSKLLNDIRKSVEFLKYKQIYENCGKYMDSLTTYYEPYIYELFRLAESRPIIFLDASFSQELFTDLLNGYDGEFGITNNFNIKIYYSKVMNKSSVVYKVYPESWYPKKSMSKNLITKVQKLYEFFERLNINVGIITFKDIEKWYFKTDYKSLHYGMLRGKNIFKSYDVLILLGTYVPDSKGITELYNQLYLDNEDNISHPFFNRRLIYKEMKHEEDTAYEEWQDFNRWQESLPDDDPQKHDENPIGAPYPPAKWEYPDKRHELINGYKVKKSSDGKYCYPVKIKARLLETILREEEMYQAIYRIRPLGKSKKIYVFGIIPEVVKDELSYEEIPINSLIADLESQVQNKERKEFNIETLFEEGRRLTDIKDEFIRKTDYGQSIAYKKINESIDNSSEWERVKIKVSGIDRPVLILKKV
jgi:hypothetical protein